MKYKGHELIEYIANIGTIFDPPKAAMVWDDGGENDQNIMLVYAYTPKSEYPVVCDKVKYRHVAFIPEKLLKDDGSRRATNLEFSRWLSQGNGQVHSDSNGGVTDTAIIYDDKCDDTPVRDGLMARKWGDKEWHEATIDYLGIKEG